jgi:hypothetical protein
MPGITSITINAAAMQVLVTGPAGPVVRQVNDVLNKTLNQCASTAPSDTGRLRASHRTSLTVSGMTLTGSVYSTAPYATYVNRGTGIYGPTGQPIRPKNGQFLVFRAGRMIGPLQKGEKHLAPTQRGLVFAREVKGSPPNPYMIIAFEENCPWPVTRLI